MKCYVDKHHHGHFLFKGIPPEFVVDVINLWDPHPVLTTSINIVKEKLTVMAESNRGPLIAMHQNSCCCQFMIDRKYRETVTILRNFIIQKVDEITFGRKKMSRTLQQAVLHRRKTCNINNDVRVMKSDERAIAKVFEQFKPEQLAGNSTDSGEAPALNNESAD